MATSGSGPWYNAPARPFPARVWLEARYGIRVSLSAKQAAWSAASQRRAFPAQVWLACGGLAVKAAPWGLRGFPQPLRGSVVCRVPAFVLAHRCAARDGGGTREHAASRLFFGTEDVIVDGRVSLKEEQSGRLRAC
jgi:hypothetical protein